MGKFRIRTRFDVPLNWFAASKPPVYASGNIDNAARNLGNTVNTPVIDWNKANHFIVAIALEAASGAKINNCNLRLEWRNKTDTGAWVTLSGTGQLIHGSTDLVEGNSLDLGEAICVPVNGTTYVAGAPSGGVEKEGAATFTMGDSLTTNQWSEYQVSVDPSNALGNKEYEFRVWDVSNSAILGPSLATITIIGGVARFAILADTAGITDIITKTTGKGTILVDTVGITDVITRLGTFFRTVVDTVGITTVLTRLGAFFRTLADTVGLTDALAAGPSGSREFTASLTQCLVRSTPIDFYSESEQTAGETLGPMPGTMPERTAQSFVATAGILTRATFFLKKEGSPPGNMVAKLYSDSGGSGPNAVLATSNTIPADSLTTTYALVDFEFEDEFVMVPSITYWISIEYSTGDTSNWVWAGVDAASPTHSGANYDYTTIWNSNTYDLCFYVNRGHPIQSYPFTIAGWVYVSAYSDRAIIGIRDESVAPYGSNSCIMYLSAINPYNARMLIHDGTLSDEVVTTTSYLLDAWNHVCAVLTSPTSRAVYLNGVGKDSSAVLVNFPPNLDKFRVGACGQGGATMPMEGLIDHPAIWSVALNDAEVLQLAQRAAPNEVQAGNLIAYWPLNGDDLDIIDAHHLSPVNSPTWSPLDSLVGGQARYAVLSDEVGIADLISSKRGLDRLIANTVGITDVLSRVAGRIRSIADTIGITDVLARTGTFFRSIVNTVGITDVISGGAGRSRSIVDTVGVTDVHTRIGVFKRTIADTVGVTDVLSNIGTFFRSIDDTIGITDTLTGIKVVFVSLADTVGVTDVFINFRNIFKSLDDGVGITDVLSNIGTFFRSVTDTIGITDSLTNKRNIFKSVADTIGITDTLVAAKFVLANLSDTVGITDVITRLGTFFRIIDNTVGVTDQISTFRGIVKLIADAVGITDTITAIRNIKKLITDTVGITDVLSTLVLKIVSLADTIGITGVISTARNLVRSILDTVGITDIRTVVRAIMKSIADTIGVADVLSRSAGRLRSLADTIGITDVINIVRGFGRTIADTIGVVDSLIISFKKRIIDSFGKSKIAGVLGVSKSGIPGILGVSRSKIAGVLGVSKSKIEGVLRIKKSDIIKSDDPDKPDIVGK